MISPSPATSSKHAADEELVAAAEELAELVISRARVSEEVKSLLRALDWPVRCAVASGLRDGWGGQHDWVLMGETRAEPRLLRRVFVSTLGLTAALVASVGVFHLLSGLRGVGPWGPTWLVWATAGGASMLLVAGVLSFLGNILKSNDDVIIVAGCVLVLGGLLGGRRAACVRGSGAR
jgi:hypothetical protein